MERQKAKDELSIRLRDGEEYLAEKEELDIIYPLYMQCYKEAVKAILRNIEHNRSDAGRKAKERKFSENGEYAAPLDDSNIIAFTGSRGSGKTTAVNEICRILSNYHQNRKIWERFINSEEAEEEEKYQFHVLTPIDASVLGEEEDLIEVILASMYQKFSQKNVREQYDEAQRNKIAQKFDEAYKHYISVRKHADPVLGESTLVKLKNISSSLKTRATFDELIKEFLRYLGGTEENKILVITIDDLDMNPEIGYEMLELLHKYLANLRVIILVAISYEQMCLITQNYFMKALMPECGIALDKVYNKYEDKAQKLSNDYLQKVIPPHNRIYIQERNCFLEKAEVGYGWKGEAMSPIKEFILKKVAVKMNIFYDSQGLKKHFCLPNTVRDLVTYSAFLESLLSMKEIETQGKTDQKRLVNIYDRNHERFNKDIEDRMAVQLLNDDQLKQYRLIMGRNIERRASYAVNFIDERLRIKSKKDEKQYMADWVDEHDYCYADLLERLYRIGREDYDDKVLVHCIMASFTSEMVRDYYSFQQGVDIEDMSMHLKRFLGRSFGGKWYNDAAPKLSDSNEAETGDNNEDNRKQKNKIAYVQSENDIEKPSKLKIELTFRTSKEESEKERIIHTAAKIVPYIECLSLLTFNFRDKSGKLIALEWKFKLKSQETELGAGVEMNVYNMAEFVDFDMFGFVGKEIENADSPYYGEKLHNGIVKSLKEGIFSFGKEKGYSEEEIQTMQDGLEEQAKETSIWSGNMNKTERKVYFPFYSFDMSYNIMKRVRRKMTEDARMAVSDVYSYFREVYGYMAGCLYDEEKYYSNLFGEEDKDSVPGFYEDFIEAPFIKAFGIDCDNAHLDREGKPLLVCEGTLEKKLTNDIFWHVFRCLLGEDKSDMREHDTDPSQ